MGYKFAARDVLASVISMIVLSGCQVTSGHLGKVRDAERCTTLAKPGDYVGAKPTWNTFGKVTSVEQCSVPKQHFHSYKLDAGFGQSQISLADDIVFHAVSERTFRERMALHPWFRDIAETVDVRPVNKRLAPAYYAVRMRGPTPVAIVSITEGYPSTRAGGWSQAHSGWLRGAEGQTLEDFAAELEQKIIAFKRDGGDYAGAFGAAKKDEASVSFAISGRWEGVGDDLSGTLATNKSRLGGDLRLTINGDGTTCRGTWRINTGRYGSPTPPQGSWSMTCDNSETAFGTFSSPKPGKGSGTGRDGKGRTIAFEYD